MTNEVPDFEKIAKEIVVDFYGETFGEMQQAISKVLESAYLAGRKAQVKVDAEISSFGDAQTCQAIAKAIESQVIP